MGRQWSSGTFRPGWNRKTGPVPVPAVKRKPNVNRLVRSRYATNERAPKPGSPVRNAPDRLGTPLMTVSLARSSGQIDRLWVVRIDAQLLGSPNCLSRSIAALTCVRKRLTADCTDGSAA
jgi:hypothetical protein